MIKLYSQRRQEKGFSYSPDSFLQRELEASFIYEDTPDQLSLIHISLMSVPNGEPASPEIVLEILKELPVTEGAAPYLEVKVLLDEPEPMLRQERCV